MKENDIINLGCIEVRAQPYDIKPDKLQSALERIETFYEEHSPELFEAHPNIIDRWKYIEDYHKLVRTYNMELFERECNLFMTDDISEKKAMKLLRRAKDWNKGYLLACRIKELIILGKLKTKTEAE